MGYLNPCDELVTNTFSLKVMNQLTLKSHSLNGCPELKTSIKTHFTPWHLMQVKTNKIQKEPHPPKN